MRRNFNGALLAIVLSSVAAMPALARRNDLTFTDGQGETMSIRHGFFGRDQAVVKDRLGDGYASSRGLFGGKEQQASILGNGFQRKKGIFGNTTVNSNTMFGDHITTKKGIFGRRTTAIDVSGSSSMLKSLWQAKGSQFLGGSGLGGNAMGSNAFGGGASHYTGSGMPASPAPNANIDPAPVVPQSSF